MKLYHWTTKENVNKILNDCLKVNGIGFSYLTKFPDRWDTLHEGGVLLEVETGDSKLTCFEENLDGSEVLCWGNIPKENIKIIK